MHTTCTCRITPVYAFLLYPDKPPPGNGKCICNVFGTNHCCKSQCGNRITSPEILPCDAIWFLTQPCRCFFKNSSPFIFFILFCMNNPFYRDPLPHWRPPSFPFLGSMYLFEWKNIFPLKMSLRCALHFHLRLLPDHNVGTQGTHFTMSLGTWETIGSTSKWFL